MHELEKIINRINRFVHERDWDQFHSPKNLAMALIVEAGELVETFQWLTEDQSEKLHGAKIESVKDEIGDVLICVLMLCEKLGIDPVEAASSKITKNERKYPVEKSRGNAKKYTEI